MAYNVMGRVSQQTLQTPYTADYHYVFPNVVVKPSASYTYDSDGNQTGMVYPGTIGFDSSQYKYIWQTGTSYLAALDPVGRPTGLNAWDPVNSVWNPVTASAAYNAAGQITSWQEGITTLTRAYDPARGWMTGLTAAAGYPYNQTYLNMQYGYNADGQVTSVTDSVNPSQAVTSYTYDNLNRLASATTSAWTMSWTYDEFGNRTSQTGSGTASSMTSSLAYNPETNRITTSGYSYDDNGNLTASPGKTYSYDAFDRLVSGSYGNRNSYDAFGRRMTRTLSDGSTQFYFYDLGGRLIQEYHWDPNVQCSIYGTLVPCPTLSGTPPVYTYFAGQQVGKWTDRTGSKRKDAGGTASHYYPYGEEITGTGNDTFKFAQTYRDSDSGLDYADQRYYANDIGRFLNPDPSGSLSARSDSPQSLNRYSYTEGDPVNFTDPSGQYRSITSPVDPFGNMYSCGYTYAGMSSEGTPTWSRRCAYATGPAGPEGSDSSGAFPECNPGGSDAEDGNLAFVAGNYAAAMGEASQVQKDLGSGTTISTGALATTFLQWSAWESGWGQNASNVAANNYFGLQQGGVGAWGGNEIACPKNDAIPGNSTNACFAASMGWGQQLVAGLNSASGKTGATYISALESALRSNPGSMAGALQAIATNGWNSLNKTYGSDITTGIKMQGRINCLKKFGYIK